MSNKVKKETSVSVSLPSLKVETRARTHLETLLLSHIYVSAGGLLMRIDQISQFLKCFRSSAPEEEPELPP